MSKNNVRWWVVFGVVLVVFNVLAFALPFVKTPVFFVSYGFTMAAILAQIYVIRTAFFQGEELKSKFYGFPIARVGVIYLAAQLILGLIFMAVGTYVPVWIPIVVYTLLLGAAVIGFVAADAARDEVERQDVKQVKEVFVMRSMQASVNAMVDQCEPGELQTAVQKLAESLRYSDPVSNDALASIEAQLADSIRQLKQAVIDKDADGALKLCKNAEMILSERNQLCKLTKK